MSESNPQKRKPETAEERATETKKTKYARPDQAMATPTDGPSGDSTQGVSLSREPSWGARVPRDVPPIKGYKIFGPNWTCHGFKYNPDKITNGRCPLWLNACGLHFCLKAVDCREYYEFLPENCYAEVESLGEVVSDGIQVAAKQLKITKVMTLDEFKQLCTGVVSVKSYHGTERITTMYVKGEKHGQEIVHSLDGKTLYTTRHYVAGKGDGEEIWFNRDGGLYMVREWRNGEYHGKCTHYHDNGTVSCVEYYNNGKWDGETRFFNPDGTTKKLLTYRNGKMHGPAIEYWPNGQEQVREEWTNGSQSGVWIWRDESGNVTHQKDYDTKA